MANHIVQAQVNLHDGVLAGTIAFQPGLNLISGENGTLKTKLLQALKGGANVQLSDPSVACRRQAISPKRNALRRAFQQVFELFRRNNTKLEGLINERNINDAAFEEYPALGDLYYVVYDDLCKDGGSQIEKMNAATAQFNAVITRIFPHYRIVAEWNAVAGAPSIRLMKNNVTPVPLEGLSLGEQDILSLAANISSSIDRYDVFLIDEPEVHLNWHLEEKLFEFFDDLCETHGTQMIIVTHSRVVFKQRFYPKTQFLYWNDQGKVSIGRDVTPEQRRRIAGDAIEIIRLGAFSRPTMFVEDHDQVVTVEELAAGLLADVAVTECDNKSNVRSLYRLSLTEGGWPNSFFLEDGDNEGNPHPGDDHFIHLDKYCIEAYLLDFDLAASACGCSQDDIRSHLFAAVIANKDKIFRQDKFFAFLIDYLTIDHLTPENLAKLDAAEVIHTFLERLRLSFRDCVARYVREAIRQGRISDVFPALLLASLKPPIDAPSAAPAESGS